MEYNCDVSSSSFILKISLGFSSVSAGLHPFGFCESDGRSPGALEELSTVTSDGYDPSNMTLTHSIINKEISSCIIKRQHLNK